MFTVKLRQMYPSPRANINVESVSEKLVHRSQD